MQTNQGHFVCDVDGVLLDIVNPACDILNKDFGTNLTPAHITTWDWEYCLSFPPGYWPEFWQKLWSTPSHPYVGANRFLAQLRALGFIPVGLSTRPQKWFGLKPVSLARDAAERDNEALDLAYILYVEKHEEKVQKVHQHWPEARYSIEDNPKNARDLGALCPNIARSMLMDRPWNRSCMSVQDDWTRVWAYSDIINQLTSGGLR
jgi:hypothetical protein